jgi:CubicO group peptidase (beta-lactamase class C family)
MANLEHDVPIGPETVFRIGSTSKQMTAGAIALLAEEGVLSLDDPLTRWIPELPAYADDVTVRHMLNHTGGLRDYLALKGMAGYRGTDWYSDGDALEMIVRQRQLNFEPGSDHLYSNSGYFLASVIVERATGMSLAEYAGESMFRPLGMESTHFHNDPTRVVRNRATGYAPIENGYRIFETILPMIGDGGVFTTVQDLAAWVHNLVEPTRIGGKRWRDVMLAPGVLSNGDTIDYALGLYYGEHRGLRTVGHSGGFVGFRADLTRYPDHDLTVYALCNRSDATPTRYSLEVGEVFLADHLSPEAEPIEVHGQPIAVSPAQMEEYVGRYEADQFPGFVTTVSREGDRLTIQQPGQQPFDLVPTSDSTFVVPDLGDAVITFRRSEEGPVEQFSLGDDISGRENPAQRLPEPEDVDLRPYLGRYFSEELQVHYTITMKDDDIVLRLPHDWEIALQHLRDDAFGGSGMPVHVVFERDSLGRIIAFRAGVGRVRGILFERVK